MTPQPRHELVDITRAPGELSFEARIGDEAQRLWIRSATPVTPPADAALAACLMPAMRSGGTLTMADPVSPRLLRTQREFQAIQRAWSLDWYLDDPPLLEVEVVAPSRDPGERPQGRVAAFFSGGVDSWSTVLTNPDITDLIFVRGLDLVPGAAHQVELADEIEARLGDAAAALGLPLHVVETNVRELSDKFVRWEAFFSCPMVAIALFFEPLFERVLIAGDTDHQTQPALGGSRMVDQLWSTELLEIVEDGGRFTRGRRLELIVDHPVVQETLRVCWENHGGRYNCGRCRKCMLTMVSLEALGAREQIATFPPELELGLFADFEIVAPVSLILWEDALETMRTAGRPDLAQAIEPMVVRGRRNLGRPPPSRRARRRPGEAAAAVEPAENQAQVQLEALLDSRSWRITAPLRRANESMRAKLVYVLKTVARRLRWAPADIASRLRGERLTPPRGLSFVGGGDFERTGREFLGHFREQGGLQPGDRVLDIGCGIGRMAVPLMGYLGAGSYAGFDVGKEMIGWCERHISRERPDFEFAWAPVYNQKYSPFGTISSTEFRFPYPDSSFDFAFATSLFTHLVKEEARHYLLETARVLRPGGTCLLTFFLLHPDAERELAAGRTSMHFRHEVDGGLTTDPQTPEEAIAYRVEVLHELLAEAGLSVREPIHFGLWSNTPGGVSGQDIVVARRDPGPGATAAPGRP